MSNIVTESKATKSGWQRIKKVLGRCSENDLCGIIYELYRISPSNKDFLEARFLEDTKAVERYKAQIKKYLSPDFNNPWDPSRTVRLKEARKILSDYKKASSNTRQLMDLMLYYLETGINYSNKFGGLYSAYYSSLQSVFTKLVELMKTQDDADIEKFLNRLKIVVKKSQDSGYWFYESVSEILEQACFETKNTSCLADKD